MKKRLKNKTKHILLKSLAGILLSASASLLPVSGYAEEVVTGTAAEAGQTKYVMPQEQVYLDPSQTEAAKKQLEADAYYNSQPQTKNVEVVSGDRVIANVEVVEKKEEPVKPAAPATTVTETPAVPAENPPAVKEEPKEPSPAVVPAPEAMEKPEPPAEKDSSGKPIQLHRFGTVKEYVTQQATVADVLKDLNVNMEERTVYPAPETVITDGMVIHVLARKSFLSHEEVEIPFQTKIIEDPELEYGTKKVEKPGVKGKDIVTYENITRTGHEQKIELDRKHVILPADEVVRQGVAQSVLTPNGYVKYKKLIYGEATAYTWGGGASGTTSLGLWPKRGIVAVDPRMIPYYTKMYIPGYGFAMAGDTGGAIVGHRIDLFMDSLYECYQWGRRDVEIYILE